MPVAERSRLTRWRDRLPKSCSPPHEEEIEGQLELARLLKVGGRKRRATPIISDGRTAVILDKKGVIRTRDRIVVVDLLRRRIWVCKEKGEGFTCSLVLSLEDEAENSRRHRWPKDVFIV